MDCDIHLHIEVKIKDQWHHYAAPDIGRRYDLFALMAGVRNNGEITPISEPKGLPGDASVITWIDYFQWEADAHSHSWLGVEEIDKLAGWLHKKSEVEGMWVDLEHHILHTYLFDSSFSWLHKLPADYPSEIEDVRFVFWFDS